MKIKLQTSGHFDAAHHLKDYKGCCQNNHGHRWNVEIIVVGDSSYLTNNILFDFKILKESWNRLDHQDLNEYFEEDNPTAEFLAMNIYTYLDMYNTNKKEKLKFRVKVFESPESFCEVGDEI